ncbi:MAG: hypothetical protein DKINENOH_01683 [bacterium]|nr:hypothetical protein [bacterium]
MPFLGRFGSMRRAYAQATYTWPAHMSMMVGFFPHCFDKLGLYNRYIRQVIRMGNRKGTGGGKHQQDPLLLVDDRRTLVHGFKRMGYNTICTGAVTWLDHPFWAETFEHYAFLHDAPRQVDWFVECVRDIRPFFALLNFGETHEPYSHGDVKYIMPEGYQEHKLGDGPLSKSCFRILHLRQIKAFEFLDSIIAHLYAQSRANTIFIFTSDHGECFGENGFFGHGFYHRKVMEVPLLIFSK